MKILTVLGARPQFIKAAALSAQLKGRSSLSEVILHTGQHFDQNLSGAFFEELDIPEPKYNLGIGGGGHGVMTGQMLQALEPVLADEKPDMVLVYGDTNSTLAGALAAAKLAIPVAHVEAGLRSFNRAMPEELNRVVADHVSTLLFCPTQNAARQLADEGLREQVHVVGDVMYDATLAAINRAEAASSILDELGLEPRTYAVATVHRAENTDTDVALAKIVDWLEERSRETTVILPMHPRTAARMEKFGLTWRRVRAIPPVGYLDMAALLSQARTVFTDSGGLQKEAYFHRVPCVTLRGETEWTETIEAGWNRLWSVPDYRPRREIDAFGDGRASDKIADILCQWADQRS